MVIVGMHNVSERSGSWDADYYLYETWPPTDGFTPQTDVVNEITRQSSTFDQTELRAGRCIRTRRIRSTLSTGLNFRMFPFDSQRLHIQFSDADYGSESVRYSAQPLTMGIDDVARDQLSSWKLFGNVTYSHVRRSFRWEDGAPNYDYAIFAVSVRRHITFHLVRFFMPLLVIVAVAFGTFWMHPEDLGSQVSVNVTCLLAAIAFQFAQANSLPEVAYLTLADRVYAICYLAIALALAESVRTNALVRAGERARALQLDRRSRIVFPALLAASIVWAVLHSLASATA